MEIILLKLVKLCTSKHNSDK